MSRRREIPKREILPDPKYGNLKLAKFVNIIMKSGKKSVAEKIIYGALDIIAEKGKSDVIQTLDEALEKLRKKKSANPES